LWFYYDPNIEVALRVVTRKSEKQWFEEIKNEQKIPFNRLKGPLIRFVLVHGENESELIIICQHSICDGTALAFLLRDILKLVSNPNEELTQSQPNFLLTDILSGSSNGLATKLKNAIISRINAKWQQDPFLFDYEDYENIHKAFFNKYQYEMVLLELNERQTKELTLKCRDNGVTINSALTCAFIIAYQDINGLFSKSERTVVMPFDLRRRLNPPLNDVFCLLVGSVEVLFNYKKTKSFWENVRGFHQQAVKKINNRTMFSSAVQIESLDPTLADVIISFTTTAKLVSPDYSRYEKLNAFAQNKKNVAINMSEKFLSSLPGTIMTNLGRLDFPDSYGNLRLDTVYFAPSGSTTVPLLLGAVGASGKLTLTITFLETGDDEVQKKKFLMEEVRDRALAYLGIT
ncbi:MAG: hypothetical protein ACFFC7_16755, partial [Candidatus Hermodarchaeota archaeon]